MRDRWSDMPAGPHGHRGRSQQHGPLGVIVGQALDHAHRELGRAAGVSRVLVLPESQQQGLDEVVQVLRPKWMPGRQLLGALPGKCDPGIEFFPVLPSGWPGHDAFAPGQLGLAPFR